MAAACRRAEFQNVFRGFSTWSEAAGSRQRHRVLLSRGCRKLVFLSSLPSKLFVQLVFNWWRGAKEERKRRRHWAMLCVYDDRSNTALTLEFWSFLLSTCKHNKTCSPLRKRLAGEFCPALNLKTRLIPSAAAGRRENCVWPWSILFTPPCNRGKEEEPVLTPPGLSEGVGGSQSPGGREGDPTACLHKGWIPTLCDVNSYFLFV